MQTGERASVSEIQFVHLHFASTQIPTDATSRALPTFARNLAGTNSWDRDSGAGVCFFCFGGAECAAAAGAAAASAASILAGAAAAAATTGLSSDPSAFVLLCSAAFRFARARTECAASGGATTGSTAASVVSCASAAAAGPSAVTIGAAEAFVGSGAECTAGAGASTEMERGPIERLDLICSLNQSVTGDAAAGSAAGAFCAFSKATSRDFACASAAVILLN